jgi:ribosomal-protein-alanine N-acetyltransferase
MSRLHIEHGLNWRWTPKKIRRYIKDHESMVLIASVRGEISGFAIMKFGDTQAHLYLLAVEPKLRRRGTGKSMLDWLERSCQTAGIANIRLEVRANNKGALKFYAAQGYGVVGRLSGYYERRETAVVLGKSLLLIP